MRRASDEEFYVGYSARAPARVARRLRLVSAALIAAAAATALVLGLAQRRLDLRLFEFASPREFSGTIELAPAPTLVVSRPGGGASRYLLVGPGKHGARALVATFDGREVRLRANLISRGEQTALEVEPGSLAPTLAPARAAAPIDLGARVLSGEIVDSKCHFGVMNPGEGKAHKACAIRCISGGAPPLLRVREPEGNARYFLLTGSDGREVGAELLDFVAEPVEIRGRVERHDDLYVLRIEAGAVRRLSDGDSGGAPE
jgi:hypothetical protein